MSGSDKLKKKIIYEATEQAERVMDEARSRAAEIVREGEKKAAGRKEEILKAANAQAEERRRRALTIAGLDARKKILGAKEQLIEDTFAQALSRLSKMDKSACQEMVLPLLLEAAQRGTEEIIVSPRHREYFDASFMQKVNRALAEQGKEGRLFLSEETRRMEGGFILRSGELEVNNSFDSILRMQRDQLEPDVAAVLFGE